MQKWEYLCERGRRPDVVILAEDHIYVQEFKQYATVEQAHLDQVSAYSRDLANYHSVSRGHPIVGILVITKANELQKQLLDIWVATPDRLFDVITQLITPSTNYPIDPIQWIESEYDPLPTLVDAARRLFKNEPLPRIRQAQSAGISDTVSELVRIAREARTKRERHLAIVTGVPGAGKTLVGLQFVYEDHLHDDSGKRSAREPETVSRFLKNFSDKTSQMLREIKF